MCHIGGRCATFVSPGFAPFAVLRGSSLRDCLSAGAPIPTAQEVRLIKTAACLPSQLAKAWTLATTAQSLPQPVQQ